MAHEQGRLPVSLNSVSYAIDLGGFERGFLPWNRQPIDVGGEPGESTLNPLGLWRYTITDWSLGAGQEFQDIETSSGRRFWDSFFIDPWTHGQITLRPLLDDLKMYHGNTRSWVRLAGGRVWVCGNISAAGSADTAYYTSDMTPDAPTWTTSRASTVGQTTSFTSDGDLVWWAHHDSGANYYILEDDDGTLTAYTCTVIPYGLAYSNGFLFGEWTDGSGDQIFGYFTFAGSVATPNTSKNHAGVDVNGQSLVGTPRGVYYATEDGRIWFCSIDSATSAPGTPTEAALLPSEEDVRSMTYASGFMFLVTSAGYRLAAIGGDDTLTYGPLIQPGAGTGVSFNTGLASSAVWGSFVSAGIDSYQVRGSANVFAGTIQFNLAEFTEPLVPAWATEMLRVNTLFPSTYTVADVAIVPDPDALNKAYPYVAFYGSPANDNDLGVYGPKDSTGTSPRLAANGYVTSGWIRFGIGENKIPRAIGLRLAEPLPTGASVKVYIIEEDGTQTLVDTYDSGHADYGAGLGPTKPFSITGISGGEKFRVKTELYNGAQGGGNNYEGPTVTSVTLYAVPVPARTEQFILPLIDTEYVEGVGGQRVRFDPDTVYSNLRTLVKNRNVVTLEFGSESHNVVVENVEIRRSADRWNRDQSGVEGVVFVTCQTADVEAS